MDQDVIDIREYAERKRRGVSVKTIKREPSHKSFEGSLERGISEARQMSPNSKGDVKAQITELVPYLRRWWGYNIKVESDGDNTIDITARLLKNSEAKRRNSRYNYERNSYPNLLTSEQTNLIIDSLPARLVLYYLQTSRKSMDGSYKLTLDRLFLMVYKILGDSHTTDAIGLAIGGVVSCRFASYEERKQRWIPRAKSVKLHPKFHAGAMEGEELYKFLISSEPANKLSH